MNKLEKLVNELLKISAEETFYELVKIYGLQEVINKEPVQEEGETDKDYEARLDAYNEKMETYEDKSGKEI